MSTMFSGICYQEWGRQEEFEQGSLALDKVKRRTRWFKFGDGCTIELGEQLDLLNEIIGLRVGAPPLSTRPFVMFARL